ncbi:ATP-binding cassette transporter [Coprinopsis marcescibilis]|uniref:ATP-binding cassette transporter n=1 Tax=Coprinopsis marcescibilis TaxID=230819 RepID=A0A5C3LD96_COPMA|nr:ATP-binding cassette transporter [Coprinopsis marcescibilis]
MTTISPLHQPSSSPLFLVQLASAFTFQLEADFAASKVSKLWSNTLIIPAYVALLSSALIVVHTTVSSRRVRKLWARLTGAAPPGQSSESYQNERREATLATDLAEHVQEQGGAVIFAFQLLRFLSCAALLALSIASLVVDQEDLANVFIFGKKGKKRKEKERARLTERELLDMILAMTNFYALSLSVAVLSSKTSRAKVVVRHLNVVLLSFLCVYIYRDIYPLMTFYHVPMDKAEGWLLWVKIGLLFFSSCFIPAAIPRRYTPVDPKDPMPVPNAEQTASLFSLVVYSFLDPVISLARTIPTLSSDLLPPLADYDRAKYLRSKAFPHLDAFASGNKRHLFFSLMRVFRTEYMILAAMITVQVIASFASPLGIKNLLYYLENNGDGATIKPWFWIVWLFLGPFVGSIAFQWYIYIATRTLVRTECLITQLVFEHSLRIRVKAEGQDGKGLEPSIPATPDSASIAGTPVYSEDDTLHSQGVTETTLRQGSSDGTSDAGKAKADKEGSSSAKNLIGKINNLVTTDLGNIVDSRDFLYILIYIPLQISLCILFLYKVLGWSSFVGLAVMVLLFPLPGYVAKLVQDVQVIRLKKTDARVETVSEAMNVLRMIKMFGWERKMDERIAEKRENELLFIWKRQILDLINGSLNFVIPVATMVASYATFASIVFSSMTVFDMLRDQLHIVFFSISQTITGKVSLDRVDDFLKNTELLDSFSENKQPSIVPPILAEQSASIGFHDASFTWSSDADGALTPSKRKFVLKIEDDLFFPLGKLSLVVGPTGSGKTSLLMALLGEMHYIPLAPDSWFNLPRAGGIAYAAQESWVQNETIRENILFGSPYDEDRYNKVISQCSLAQDLNLFEAGDQTEVGEKGLTLSGGQKARITLARAIYSPAEILLLDDVLAALDVHTAKWIVEKCFSGDLVQGRTVILVTHNVSLASSVAEYVVSFGSDGRIKSQGSISEVLKIDTQLVKEFGADEELVKKSDNEIDGEAGPAPPKDGKLIIAEEVEEGHVSWSALKMYFSALGGNRPIFFFFIYIFGLILCEAALAIQTWFLGYWASQYTILPSIEVPVFKYLGIYGTFLLVATSAYAASFVLYIFGSIRASRVLHLRLIQSILGTTLRWLDTTPISRVITRCTQDIRAVDGPLSSGLWYLSEMTLAMLIKFGAVVLLTPAFLLPGVLVAILGGWIGQLYIHAQLSVKREMSNAKAPVLGHFGAAISGLTSLRAYGAQQAFIAQSLTRIDRYTKASRTFYNLNRWVCIRVDALGGLFTAALAGYLIYFQGHSASNTGFSLNMAVGFSSMILWWIRVLNDFEVQGNSLERIEQYINIEQEPKPTVNGVPPAYWPADGSLHVENLSARYSADGPQVLRDITFDVKSGERIGIVGRTGSGKSSLTLSILRCIFTEGKVVYAGRDVGELNLDALRSNITIIPQVPELLSGSLRQNLDPFEQFDDAILNDALRSAGLSSLQEGSEEGKITLDTSISSGGGNLSVGQRQIIALARAIVRGSKLLILDEATSAIDHKTDGVIQSSLRNQLGKDVTLLTVAHRLQTIMDADKIMVLDGGNIVEFDKPSELLKNRESKLRALVEESGDKEALLAMAGFSE